MRERFYIGDIGISRVNLHSTLDVIDSTLRKNKIGYICVTNSRVAHYANQHKEYCSIQNNSLLSVPDGVPLVWMAHNVGLKEVDKVSGKDLMDALFEISAKKNYSHYFYGSTPETINKLESNLMSQYPGIDIAGAVSPPFQPVEEFNIDEIANEINKVKPSFFWCGLGAPKQELLIAKLQPKLESTICIGVGLAFEYIAGTVKRAPQWLRNIGLEWMYRLAQQPKNMSRAVRPLTWMGVQVIKSFSK